jgi:hypothetical protein
MLTDGSPGLRDSWEYLDRRLDDLDSASIHGARVHQEGRFNAAPAFDGRRGR